jgi:hypothetical protein
LPRDRVALHHHAPPRPNREDVRTHAVELLIGHFDEPDPAVEQPLAERHWHQRGVDDRQIPIDGTDDRHEVEHVAGAAPVGKGDDDQFVDRIAEERAQLRDARIIRPVPPPDGDRPIVQPDDIPALEPAGRHDGPHDRDSGSAESPLLGYRLSHTRVFAHPAEDGAAVADDRRVPDVDRVQPGALDLR